VNTPDGEQFSNFLTQRIPGRLLYERARPDEGAWALAGVNTKVTYPIMLQTHQTVNSSSVFQHESRGVSYTNELDQTRVEHLQVWTRQLTVNTAWTHDKNNTTHDTTTTTPQHTTRQQQHHTRPREGEQDGLLWIQHKHSILHYRSQVYTHNRA